MPRDLNYDPSPPVTPKKLAILCDYAEENWPSMELVAEMLGKHLRADHAQEFNVAMLQPPFKHRISRLPLAKAIGAAKMADRLINRLHDYPKRLAKRAGEFDLFHLADHSYSQLLHVLPADRTGVFCHDLDTFRCLLDPKSEPRPKWFRVMARRILEGMQKARVVFHSTCAVREAILKHGLIDPARLICAPFGVSEEFSTHEAQAPSETIARTIARGPFLLHVGSCIPRKRVDILLEVFANLHKAHPEFRLVKVGGDWSAEHVQQMSRLRIVDQIEHLNDVSSNDLAALYRSARALVIPSDAEGFGLPLAEGLGCGTLVIASDIAALREVGGDAAIYCRPGDVEDWTASVLGALAEENSANDRSLRLGQAAQFSWLAHADRIASVYGAFL